MPGDGYCRGCGKYHALIRYEPKEICAGVRGIKITENCPNKAKWEVHGLVASFGCAIEEHLCDKCLEIAIQKYPHGYPMILSENQYLLAWRKIDSDDEWIKVKIHDKSGEN